MSHTLWGNSLCGLCYNNILALGGMNNTSTTEETSPLRTVVLNQTDWHKKKFYEIKRDKLMPVCHDTETERVNVT